MHFYVLTKIGINVWHTGSLWGQLETKRPSRLFHFIQTNNLDCSSEKNFLFNTKPPQVIIEPGGILMNINNLKTTVPAKLYERGLDYFEQDFVEQLTEDAPNRGHALVTGTQDYEVSVNLAKDGTIVGSYCTCPFESDSLCKHEVAVCLAIREYKKEKGSSAVGVQARLKTLKKAELLEILEELVEKQPTVQLYLAEKFADPNGIDEEKARRLIQKSVSRASRRGFIEWDRTDQALDVNAGLFFPIIAGIIFPTFANQPLGQPDKFRLFSFPSGDRNHL